MDIEESDYEATGDLDEVDLDDLVEGEESDTEIEEETHEVPKKVLDTVESYDEMMKRWEENRDKRKSFPFLTKYEYTKMIGIRAEQISKGAKPLVETEGLVESIDIAEREYKEGKLPFLIERPMPNGTTELWRLDELINVDH